MKVNLAELETQIHWMELTVYLVGSISKAEAADNSRFEVGGVVTMPKTPRQQQILIVNWRAIWASARLEADVGANQSQANDLKMLLRWCCRAGGQEHMIPKSHDGLRPHWKFEVQSWQQLKGTQGRTSNKVTAVAQTKRETDIVSSNDWNDNCWGLKQPNDSDKWAISAAMIERLHWGG